MVSDYGKLIVLMTVMILGVTAGTLLLVTHTVSEAAGVGIITLCVSSPISYIMGNGALAVSRKAPSSVIVPKVQNDEVLTINGSYPVDRTSTEENAA